jgi:hypothetical protein
MSRVINIGNMVFYNEDWHGRTIIFDDVPNYGDLIEIEEFLNDIESGGFIDYDGCGHFATSDKMSNVEIWIKALFLGKQDIPNWATHIMWFNK